MRHASVILTLIALAACSASEPPPPPAVPAAELVATPPAIPESELFVLSVGGNGFRADMDLAALRSRYGAAAVVEQEVPLGEGQSEPGAVIYPNDATRRAYVYFVDAKIDGTISSIYIRDTESRWVGPMGLRMNMTTVELTKLNGKPFRFLGFDWDYGGYVSNWTGGALSTAFLAPGQLAVRLAPPDLAAGVQRADGYPAGESEFASDLPSVREQPPVVVEMGLGFVPAAADSTAAPTAAPG